MKKDTCGECVYHRSPRIYCGEDVMECCALPEKWERYSDELACSLFVRRSNEEKTKQS